MISSALIGSRSACRFQDPELVPALSLEPVDRSKDPSMAFFGTVAIVVLNSVKWLSRNASDIMLKHTYIYTHSLL